LDKPATLLSGGVSRCLDEVQSLIRAAPADADLRARLFQLAAVQGDWGRAAEQLRLCVRFDPAAQAMAALYGQAIAGEREREAVFAGVAEPLFPAGREPWCDLLLQAMALDGTQPARAAALRGQALQDAREQGGTLLAGAAAPVAYAWMGDGDSRLGPVCEWIAGGRYAWLPLQAVRRASLLAPEGVCDLLWARAEIVLAGGRTLHGLVPARYPAPAGRAMAEQDESLRLGRETRWQALPGETYAGAGQKMWITDAGEFALLDVRRLDQEAA